METDISLTDLLLLAIWITNCLHLLVTASIIKLVLYNNNKEN